MQKSDFEIPWPVGENSRLEVFLTPRDPYGTQHGTQVTFGFSNFFVEGTLAARTNAWGIFYSTASLTCDLKKLDTCMNLTERRTNHEFL